MFKQRRSVSGSLAEPLFLVALASLALSACGGGGSATGPVSNNASSAAASNASTTPTAPATSNTLVSAAALRPEVNNPSGSAATVSQSGESANSNPFFQSFGNGRTCASCHDQNAGWSLTPQLLKARFAASRGTDPVFLPVDGANSPNAPVATVAQRATAYSMLLNKGLIRIGLPMPANAQFSLTHIDDPYQFASASELSLFRRPQPVANLKFETAVMWDGRETLPSLAAVSCIKDTSPAQCFASLAKDLESQASSAVLTHEQAVASLSAADQVAIVSFTTGLFNAQATDEVAGSLSARGAEGGAQALADLPFHFGINDVFNGDYASGAAFDPNSMALFAAWPMSNDTSNPGALARASIARGEEVFNHKRFPITGVAGFNDVAGLAVVHGTCTSCHSTPGVGTHSVPRFMNTGITDAQTRTPDLPLYTFTNSSTGQSVQLSDPGLGLQTGRWTDLGKVKVPGLRALQSRPPFFHNGFAPDVEHVIDFYQHRFNIPFTPQEAADLAAFLKAL